MEVVKQHTPTTFPTQQLAPGHFTRYGQGPSQTLQKESDREGKVQQIYVPSFLSPKEEFSGEQDHIGPVSPEPIYSSSFIQDAYLERGQATASPWSMDYKHRFKGWLLAPVSRQSISPLPRFHIQGSKLAIQSNAIWSESSPLNIHKIDQVCSPQTSRGEHMVSPLPGRSPDHSFIEARVHIKDEENLRDTSISRLDHQQGEVQTHSPASLRMARHPVRPEELQSSELNQPVPEIQLPVGIDFYTGLVHKTRPYEYTRNRELAGTSGPITQNSLLSVQTTTESPETRKNQHQTHLGQQTENLHGQVVTPAQQLSPFGDPRTPHYHPNGCFQDRHRFHSEPFLLPTDSGQIHETVLYQHLGTPGYMDGNNQGERKECNNENHDRQLYCSVCNQKSFFYNISPCLDSRDDMEESINNELVPISSSHQGDFQCSGRSTISQHNHINRVVTTKRSIQTRSSSSRTQTRNRPVCYKPQSSTGEVHLTMPRPKGSGNKCSSNELGTMEPLLHVSTQAYDFEGFTEDEAVKYKNSSLSDNRNPGTSIHKTTEITAITRVNIQSEATTSGSQQASNRQKNVQNSRLEILKEAISSTFPNCDDRTINLMSETIKKSSENEYQRKWESFIDYVHSKGIDFEDINKGTVISFLSHLFHVKKLKPSTISHYRSALARPLLEYFKEDLNCSKIQLLIRGMRIRRPNEPSPKPQWSLNKVLTLLEDIVNSSETISLRKTAFLLFLATGWRISEVHACVREEQYTSFNERGSLLIKPHSSFLAKNGLRKRIEQREIGILKDSSGHVSKLCPVTAIKQYLNITIQHKSGCLFINPKNGRAMTLSQLRYQICSLITEADPDTRARVHDIRKYAASITLQQDMLVGDLIQDFN